MKKIINEDYVIIVGLLEEIENDIYNRMNNIKNEEIENDILIDLYYRKYIILYLELYTLTKISEYAFEYSPTSDDDY
jgi:hypothetical protein